MTDTPEVPAERNTNRALAMLLRIADGYYHAKNIRQSTEMYFDIIDKHDGTPEAEHARERLMAIAEYYESSGQLRQARALAERLL